MSVSGAASRAGLFAGVLLVAGAAGGGIYLADRFIYEPARKQERRLARLEKQKKELEAVVGRFKYTVRRALITVLDQKKEPHGFTTTTFRFEELDPAGNPLGKGIERTVIGEEVYFDALVIKFDDKKVAAGDALRGKSLLLFRRVFTNKQQPDAGYPLDERGVPPLRYAAKHAPSALERDLWAKFWEYADDPHAAAAKGVRALHGDAPYIKMYPDKVYLLELRATGELTIRPLPRPPTEKKAAPPPEARGTKKTGAGQA